MRNYKMMTEHDIKDMFEMFDAGLKSKEISELTGRSLSVVGRYKKRWKSERKSLQIATIEEVPKQETDIESKKEESDYAKAYYANDAAHVCSAFEIQRSVRIKSKKTGFVYELDTDNEDQIMKITLADGSTINIEIELFEKFVDEGIDVYLEMKRTA